MSLADILPPSLNLSPHLSAHKYFFVCTLTVAAWDTLVLSPRTWRLMKTPEWPALKVIYHFLRVFMPVEFTIVGVAFFDTKWSQATCRKFYLFEPICTAILLAACSAVHVVRIHAIYEKSRAVLAGMSALLLAQVVVTAVCCAFYFSVPLEDGQGCIAGPRHKWVGVYWVAPTLLYTASFALAIQRSVQSLQIKPLGPWRLMLRDGLNLYGAIWIVNLVNVLFWFIIKPTGPSDPIRTIVTSMAAVLTTSMTLRIVLSVRGSLVYGGTFHGAHSTAHSGSASGSRGTTHVISTPRTGFGGVPSQLAAPGARGQTYTVDVVGKDGHGQWVDSAEGEFKGAVVGDKDAIYSIPAGTEPRRDERGVKITTDREVEYDNAYRGQAK